MKKRILYASLPFLLILIYFLFEPIVIYNIGWKDLPVEKNNNPERNDSALFAVQFILRNAKKELQAPAISVAVGINDEVVWAEAIGFKDIELSESAEVNTSFRIGSTSKALTFLALGKLLEGHQFDLDTPIQKYVSYISIKKPITIRQIASHMSGIRNYSLCFCVPVFEYYNNDLHESVKQSINAFQNDKLLFEPGSQYSYTTYNYTLLSAVIEELSGTSYLEYMDQQLFQPLNMTNTSPDYSNRIIKNRATFYEIKEGQYKEVYQVDNSNKWAGGGFLSTPTDLVKLGNAVLGNHVLKQETLDTLFTPQKLNSGVINEEGYALGWRVSKEKKIFERKKLIYIVHHGGTALGSTSFLVLFPDYKMTISLLMNRNAPADFRDFSKYAFQIAEKFISEQDKKDR